MHKDKLGHGVGVEGEAPTKTFSFSYMLKKRNRVSAHIFNVKNCFVDNLRV